MPVKAPVPKKAKASKNTNSHQTTLSGFFGANSGPAPCTTPQKKNLVQAKLTFPPSSLAAPTPPPAPTPPTISPFPLAPPSMGLGASRDQPIMVDDDDSLCGPCVQSAAPPTSLALGSSTPALDSLRSPGGIVQHKVDPDTDKVFRELRSLVAGKVKYLKARKAMGKKSAVEDTAEYHLWYSQLQFRGLELSVPPGSADLTNMRRQFESDIKGWAPYQTSKE